MKRLFFTLLLCGMTLNFSLHAQTLQQTSTQQIPSSSQNITPSPAGSVSVSNTSVPTSTPRVWNFEGADIKTVISAVSKETGKNFIVDPRVQGKVTLISNTPMDKDEVYQVFLTLLQTYGFLVVPDGENVFKIVPDSIAKYQSIPAYTASGQGPLSGSAVMIKVIPVRNGTAEQFISLLRPLLPASSEISAYMPTNSLIVSSTASKIEEIEKIIQALDVANPGAIEIIPLHYADAADVSSAIKSMMPPTPLGKTPLMIAADKHSNSILISGSLQDRANVKSLIKKMDTLTIDTSKISNTVVINLRYLNAKDFAPILQNVAASLSGAPVSSVSASPSSSDSSANDNSASSSDNNPLTSIRGLYTAVKSNTLTASPASSSSSSYSSASSSGNANIHVQAEPATNSLIIDGSPSQIRSLRAIIAKLDVRPAQVLVEALIAEVNESTMQKLGIQWGTLPPSNANFSGLTTDASGNIISNGNGTGTGTNTNVPPFDNGFSAITGGLGVGIVTSGRIKGLITALKNDASTNILSTPSLVVLDNQEADIQVGQKRSFNNGSLNLASGGGVVNSTDMQDVALTLKVKPQIGEDGSIRLHLEHKNDVATSEQQNGNPVINDSQFKTDVMVNSGQILVIGGLISNDTEENVQKVPFLGSIPVLGRLFQYRDNSVAKKNLLIFLRPIVLNDRDSANQQTIKRYNMMRGLQLNQKRNEDILLPKGGNAVLPQWPAAPLPEPFNTHTPA